MHVLETDATELVERITAGELTASEVVEAAIAACERLNPSLNAVFSTRFERARIDEGGFGLLVTSKGTLRFYERCGLSRGEKTAFIKRFA